MESPSLQQWNNIHYLLCPDQLLDAAPRANLPTVPLLYISTQFCVGIVLSADASLLVRTNVL